MLPYCGPLDQIEKTPYQPSHGAKHMVKRSIDKSYIALYNSLSSTILHVKYWVSVVLPERSTQEIDHRLNVLSFGVVILWFSAVVSDGQLYLHYPKKSTLLANLVLLNWIEHHVLHPHDHTTHINICIIDLIK